jgi:hypothetical protein
VIKTVKATIFHQGSHREHQQEGFNRKKQLRQHLRNILKIKMKERQHH